MQQTLDTDKLFLKKCEIEKTAHDIEEDNPDLCSSERLRLAAAKYDRKLRKKQQK